jgi:hypothetical protein
MAEEDEGAEEKQWLSAMTNNPTFDFLHDEGEDIYSPTDGKPFHDKIESGKSFNHKNQGSDKHPSTHKPCAKQSS